jgi:RNA polymerase sigma-70 factor (ECF subfamily)
LTEAPSDALRVGEREDSWLIAEIRLDPPDSSALDELVNRYWKPLYGRCHLLTSDPEKAKDLAQDAWCRLLRARHSLKPDGNFPAYLMTVATNLWRDSQRHARRAGPLAEQRLASLDAGLHDGEGATLVLADALPNLGAIESEEAARLRLDIDEALGRLTPRLRDVLVARFIAGESCAEIGRRYHRTEQSVSGWVREAIREMKLHLEDRTRVGVGTEES